MLKRERNILERRFFASAQNDSFLYGHVEEQGDETSQFNVTFVRIKVTQNRRA